MTDKEKKRLAAIAVLSAIVIAIILLFFHNRGAGSLAGPGNVGDTTNVAPLPGLVVPGTTVTPYTPTGWSPHTPQVYGDWGPYVYEPYGLNPTGGGGGGMCGCGFG